MSKLEFTITLARTPGKVCGNPMASATIPEMAWRLKFAMDLDGS